MSYIHVQSFPKDNILNWENKPGFYINFIIAWGVSLTDLKT